MSATSRFVGTVDGTDGERERHQVVNEQGNSILEIEILDGSEYSVSWETAIGFEEFEKIIEENYESHRKVETVGIFRPEGEGLGEKLYSTYERVKEHSYPEGELNYLEFRYGPHTISLGRQDTANEFSLSSKHPDVEPFDRYFQRTADLPETDVEDVLGEAGNEILTKTLSS